MSIIISEEKNNSAGLVRIVGWLAMLVIIAASIYYIFFAAPDLVIIAPSGNLSTIAPIAQITIHPEDVLNSPAFQALQSTIQPPSPNGPGNVGRTNPFLP